jgi:hypothetical protein
MTIFYSVIIPGVLVTIGSLSVARYGEVTMTCGEHDGQCVRRNEAATHLLRVLLSQLAWQQHVKRNSEHDIR